MAKRSLKTKRARVDPVMKRAAELGVAHQAVNDRFEFTDVVNHSDADHRALARAIGYSTDEDKDAKRTTLRRTPKLDTEPIRKLLDARELAACHWYRDAHAMLYDTTGITANYGQANGGGTGTYGHWPKSRKHLIALDTFDYARGGINPFLRAMFERVVLHDRPLGRLRLSFKLAARQLLERIEGRVQL